MISDTLINEKNILTLTKLLQPLFRFVLWSSATLLLIFLVLNLLYNITNPEHIPDWAIWTYMFTGYACAYLFIWGVIPFCIWMSLTVIFLRYRKSLIPGHFKRELRPLSICIALILVLAIILIMRDHSTP